MRQSRLLRSGREARPEVICSGGAVAREAAFSPCCMAAAAAESMGLGRGFGSLCTETPVALRGGFGMVRFAPAQSKIPRASDFAPDLASRRRARARFYNGRWSRRFPSEHTLVPSTNEGNTRLSLLS